ncbi:MAG: MFS transporter [Planctomyces sp.]|nr:MFS transporter [Planctomyces sp.]
MPAFLSTLTDSGFIRGMLPLLNRAGQSMAPLILSDGLARATKKSAWLSRTTFLMGMPFVVLGMAVWVCGGKMPSWFSWAYLGAYALFFCLHGVNETTFSTVQGKLIPVNRRGLLTGVASVVGTFFAVTLALWLLRRWLNEADGLTYAKIFLFVGTTMMISSCAVWFLREQPDAGPTVVITRRRDHFQSIVQRLRLDPALRRVCLIAACFVFSQILFPHYQDLGMKMPGSAPVLLMSWVIAQHVGAAVFSSISGRIADAFGTRASLRLLTSFSMIAPILALITARWGKVDWFAATFFWIGVVPVTYRMLMNHTLELIHREHHPGYLSTLTFCMAVPFFLSPLVGGLVSWFGYTVPFLVVAVITGVGAWQTWLMAEPRHRESTSTTSTSIVRELSATESA